jgi:glycosyltransferase involved in cell wall biosynthesis
MSYGIPIISTELSDKMDWSDKKAGLVTETDSQLLAEGIKYLIENENDYNEMKKWCLDYVEKKFSWNNITDILEKEYDTAIKEFNGGIK